MSYPHYIRSRLLAAKIEARETSLSGAKLAEYHSTVMAALAAKEQKPHASKNGGWELAQIGSDDPAARKASVRPRKLPTSAAVPRGRKREFAEVIVVRSIPAGS